jgi:hypothetical protein
MGWTRTRGKRLQGCGSYDDYGAAVATTMGERRRANVVKTDPVRSIYRGVHRVYPLRLLLPYNTHPNNYIPII